MNFFEVKIKYDKIVEEGKQQKVNETYLVDALSFTEAEARIIEEMKPYLGGEFEVANIKKIRISDLFEDEKGDKWYKAKVMFVTVDEEKGTEKKSANQVLVQAGDIQDALKTLVAGMDKWSIDYEIAALQETLIMDVYKFDTRTVEEKQ